jgi:hypothetical protein
MTANTTTDKPSTVFAEVAVLQVIAAHAVWGWACISQGDVTSEIQPTRAAAISSRGFAPGKPVRVLVIQSIAGKPLVLPLTEPQLESLGPCPRL